MKNFKEEAIKDFEETKQDIQKRIEEEWCLYKELGLITYGEFLEGMNKLYTKMLCNNARLKMNRELYNVTMKNVFSDYKDEECY